MKVFFLSALSLMSLISSSQIIDEINTGTTLYNDLHTKDYKNETNNLSHLHSQNCYAIVPKTKEIVPEIRLNLYTDPDISVDCTLRKSPDYKIWYKLSLAEFGFSYSYSESHTSANNTQYNGAFINYSMGFHKVAGLGFGTKLIVNYGMPDNIEIHSWVPIYAHFPIYISKKKTKPCAQIPNWYNIPFMVNIYAGGSWWCSTSSSYGISEDAILADKFYQIGFNCMFFNFSNSNYKILNGNFSLDTGMIFYQIPGEAKIAVFNIGLIYTFIGKAIISYK